MKKIEKKATIIMIAAVMGVISLLLIIFLVNNNLISGAEYEISKSSAFIALSVIAGAQISRKVKNWREETTIVRILMILFSLVDVLFLIGGGYFLLFVL